MTTKEHLTKHDREITAIRKLMLVGMRILNRNQQQLQQLIADVRSLATSGRELTNG